MLQVEINAEGKPHNCSVNINKVRSVNKVQ